MAKKNRPCSSYDRLNRDFNTGGKMKNLIFVLSCILVLFTTPIAGLSAENGILAGYGFGLFNKDHSGTNVQGGNYDYIQVAYLHERQLGGRVNWVLEPFVSYINRPDEGLDGGLSLYVKAYLDRERVQGFYATVGVGILYTSGGVPGARYALVRLPAGWLRVSIRLLVHRGSIQTLFQWTHCSSESIRAFKRSLFRNLFLRKEGI